MKEATISKDPFNLNDGTIRHDDCPFIVTRQKEGHSVIYTKTPNAAEQYKPYNMPYWGRHELCVLGLGAAYRHNHPSQHCYMVELKGSNTHTNVGVKLQTKYAGITLYDWLRIKIKCTNGKIYSHPFCVEFCFFWLMHNCVSALKQLTQMGIRHGDIKADNICITFEFYPTDAIPHPNGWQDAKSIVLCNEDDALTLIDFAFAISNDFPLQYSLPQPSRPYYSLAMQNAISSGNKEVQQALDWRTDVYSLGYMFNKIITQQGMSVELIDKITPLINEMLNIESTTVDILTWHDEMLGKINNLIGGCDVDINEVLMDVIAIEGLETTEFKNKKSINTQDDNKPTMYQGSVAEAFVDNFIDWQKVGKKGEKLTQHASQWSAVLDPKNNLMWAANPNKTANFPNPEKRLTWDEVHIWVKKINKKGYCGFNDWRLPTIDELESLMLSKYCGSDLDIEGYFNDVGDTNRSVWSSSLLDYDNDCVWLADFWNDKIYHYGKSYYYVRLVRTSNEIPTQANNKPKKPKPDDVPTFYKPSNAGDRPNHDKANTKNQLRGYWQKIKSNKKTVVEWVGDVLFWILIFWGMSTWGVYKTIYAVYETWSTPAAIQQTTPSTSDEITPSPPPVLVSPETTYATIAQQTAKQYLKIDTQGHVLPDDATQWDCVYDSKTKLLWEEKTDDGGLRDKDWSYTWYNPNSKTNGGNAGIKDDSNMSKGQICGNSLNECNTKAYVDAINQQSLCGVKDWQLPAIEDLYSLIECNTGFNSVYTIPTKSGTNKQVPERCKGESFYRPTINLIFANTRSNWYWSSSLDADVSRYAWIITFDDGYVYSASKHDNGYVRLVRSSQ